jgi:hypothetical protein
MIAHQNIYDSLAEFMAGLDPDKVLAFHAPLAIQQRVEELLDKKRESGLNADEQDELEHYFILEYRPVGKVSCEAFIEKRASVNRYISEAIRAEVARRADHRCEYCLRPDIGAH